MRHSLDGRLTTVSLEDTTVLEDIFMSFLFDSISWLTSIQSLESIEYTPVASPVPIAIMIESTTDKYNFLTVSIYKKKSRPAKKKKNYTYRRE